ncbi:MAG TPA: methyltransferase domain-containing protein [Chloroflexia bacterium]|nr:methyltransferase domain-containing protein [Chloroflexia bacterium]
MKSTRERLLKFAFESLYGPLAWAYDWVSRTFFLGQWRLWQRAAIPHLGGTRVLEVGMGTGNLQLDLIREGFAVWGVDLSRQMLRQATRKARRLNTAFNICRARAQALPFPSSHFDSVVSTFPSEYIADLKTLAEIRRVLRPGGRLVIVPGGWLTSSDPKGKTFESIARVVYGYKGDTDPARLADHATAGHGALKWITALKGRMLESGFNVSAHIASNGRGACLVVVAHLNTPSD